MNLARSALAGLLIAAIAPAAAGAAYPGKGAGKLVFFQEETGGVEPVGLAVSDASGADQSLGPLGPACGGEEPGTAGAPCPEDPVWSPDGQRIAFGLGNTVATMKPDGTDVHRLALTGFRSVLSPTWSPDGSRLAFSAVRDGKRNVYVARAEGTEVVALTFAGGADPAWSTRNEIAFTRRGDVLRIPAGGGRPRRLTKRGGAQPTWSPGGSALAFVRKVHLSSKSKRRTPVLYRLGRDGRRLKRITTKRAENPSWTPDGKRVLFDRHDGFNTIILSIGANGKRGRVVTGGFEGRRSGVSQPDQQPLR